MDLLNHIEYNKRMLEVIGEASEFDQTQLATKRSVLRKSLLVKEKIIKEDSIHFSRVTPTDIGKKVAPDLMNQWRTINPLLVAPIVISEKHLIAKVTKLWERAVDVVRRRTGKKVRETFLSQLDSLFNITTCSHKISQIEEELTGISN